MPKPVQQVHLRLDREVHEAVKKAAKQRRTEINEFIRDAIVAAVGLCPTCGHEHNRTVRKRRQQPQAAA